jgi:hypothetical protein
MLPVLSHSEGDLTACFAADIAAMLESFSEKDSAGKQSLQQMLSSDPAAFSRATLRVLSGQCSPAGARYVVHLLRKENLLIEALADPRGNREDAVGAARTIPQVTAAIDADLEKALGATLLQHNSLASAARVLRLLEVLEAASPQPRFYLFQSELMAHPDPAVRSRSALLIARSGKNTSLVGKLLLDDDPRVQANAVEALWSFDAQEAHPLLTNAARSKTPRVAANAAVGLYRIGDLASIKLLFAMAGHEDGVRRTSAAWAMGETGDTRFLPYLTAWYARSSGTERLNVLQSLGRIRRREKTLAQGGAIEIRPWERHAEGPTRRLVLTLWSSTKADLTGLSPTDFAVWDGTGLVDGYRVDTQPNPALAISGFILPRFSSESDPYHVSVRDALARCLKYKRADDPWRLDRYLTESRGEESGAPLEKAALPFEESLLGPLAKTQLRGFLAVPEALRKLIETPGPRERAADDVIPAVERQAEAIVKFSGKRRLFLFLPAEGISRPDRRIAKLRDFVTHERIAVHGFAPLASAGCEEYQSLCKASEGSYSSLPPDAIAAQVERIYAQTLNRFEISYTVPDGQSAGEAAVQVACAHGCGRAEFSFA